MKVFPVEFSDLVTKAVRKEIEAPSPIRSRRRTRQSYSLERIDNALTPYCANQCMRMLNDALADVMKPFSRRIPSDSIWSMKNSYREKLAKTVRCSSADLSSPRSIARARARSIGLIDMLNSSSLKHAAEVMSGFRLSEERDLQILSYGHGDYVGPHNDHHPDIDEAAEGYVDFHLSFCNGYVENQWLVYEKNGYLNEVVDLKNSSSMTAYRLPFWHYTTPLTACRGGESRARRWVILASFDIV